MRWHQRRRGPQRASAAPPATALRRRLRPCRAARAVAARSGHWPPLVPHSQPSRSSVRRRAVEERQRWRRPRHLPWRRRPSPASPRAPAQHGSPSIAMRAAAYCLAGNLAGCAHPAPPGRHHHLPGGRQPSAQRFCNARPSGSFAVASTPPKGCSAAIGKGHHSYSLPTAAHREQDMEARRETRGAPRARAGWGISAASGPRHRDTRRHTRGTAGHEGCK